MTSNASLLFKKVALWQKAGQVSASDQSISTRIGEAALAREISALDKKAMLEFKDELKVAVACLKMADSFATARRTRNPKTAAEAETLDALIQGVDDLTDVISTSGDENLVMVQKMLSDFLMELKTSNQTTSKEQEDYEHADARPEVAIGPKAEPSSNEERTNVG